MPRRSAIVIRRAEPGDAAALAATFGEPRAMAGTLQLPFPSTELWARRLAAMSADDFLLVAQVGDAVVGNLGLHPASKSPRRRHSGTIGMAVRDDWQHKGIGSALLGAAIDLADNWVGYTRLELTAYTDNPAAIALYRKFGFEVEGTARAYAMRGGRLVDAFMMARLVPAGANTAESRSAGAVPPVGVRRGRTSRS